MNSHGPGGGKFTIRYPKDYQDADTQCVCQVWDKFLGPQQCSRKRGYGPGGKYCKQHAKMLEERKE